MQADRVKAFLKAIGAKQVVQSSSTWVTCACPLAPITHKSGKDSHPSAGVSAGQDAIFHCFTCETLSVWGLYERIAHLKQVAPELYGHVDLQTAAMALLSDDLLPVLPKYEDVETKVFTPIPEEWLSQFSPLPPEALEYMQKRGFSPPFAGEFLFDPHMQMVVAVYRNAWGVLAGARGRCINPFAPTQHHDYRYKGISNAAFCWYNEPALLLPGPVIVVEGQFDVERVVSVWPKTVGNLTAKPTAAKVLKLLDTETAYFMLDNDDAGEKALAKWLGQTAGKINVGQILYPGKDPAALSKCQLIEELKELLE